MESYVERWCREQAERNSAEEKNKRKRQEAQKERRVSDRKLQEQNKGDGKQKPDHTGESGNNRESVQ